MAELPMIVMITRAAVRSSIQGLDWEIPATWKQPYVNQKPIHVCIVVNGPIMRVVSLSNSVLPNTVESFPVPSVCTRLCVMQTLKVGPSKPYCYSVCFCVDSFRANRLNMQSAERCSIELTATVSPEASCLHQPPHGSPDPLLIHPSRLCTWRMHFEYFFE